MMVSKTLQAGAKAGPGDPVSVAMDVDRSDRVVSVPAELRDELARNRKDAVAFASLSYSHRKEFADWVAGAKKPETRLSRATTSMAMVLERKHVR
jgi:uncharacterized protein YdeI (YjbR/CyaY-like superfamily)